MNYADFPSLGRIYLEDSYVLGIDETPSRIVFTLDAVLMPGHPQYRDPDPGEQYCYAHATLELNNVTKIQWITRSNRTYTDATGEQDCGNIDNFQRVDDHYDISGDWGHVLVYAETEPRLEVS